MALYFKIVNICSVIQCTSVILPSSSATSVQFVKDYVNSNEINLCLICKWLLSFRYEGTGRSLSLKLIQQLREQSTTLGSANKGSNSASFGRSLQEITLNESIRYAPGDEVERWLNHLLCLDATVVQKLTSGCPLPENCDLYPLPSIAVTTICSIIKIKLRRKRASQNNVGTYLFEKKQTNKQTNLKKQFNCFGLPISS